MKSLIAGLVITLVSCNVFAQKSPIKFGDVPIEDLKMTVYDNDSSASAVILADYGQSAVVYRQSDGFKLLFERTTRIKILKKAGLDWATFEVLLYDNHNGEQEKISGLKGLTYNLENGKVVQTKLKSDGIFREKVNENYDMAKFTLPNVREGSVIEVTYEINSDFIFHLQDWDFQSTIPVRWSEYRARIPEYFFYDKYMQGYIPLELNEEKQLSNSITLNYAERGEGGSNFTQDKIDFMENHYRWAAKDVPAFKPEPYITTTKDYMSKISFELAHEKFPNRPIKKYMGTWADISKTYNESENFGKAVTGNNFLKKIVDDILTGATTPEQKIAIINTYVKRNVAWDGTSLKFLSTPFKKVLDDKKGSSAEINLMLASMLEKAGFDVSPVLVSTRDHGFIREGNAISSQFNYVVCHVKFGDKEILLDATDALLPTGVLPERCLNGRGFKIAKTGEFAWVPLKSVTKSLNFYTVDLILSAEGELKGSLRGDRSGYFAHRDRKKYNSKGEQEYIKDLIGSKGWTINKSEFTNLVEVNESFREAHDLVINDHAIASDAVIYINPFVVLQLAENPFKLEKREYPVDFGSPLENLYTFRLKIPAGYVVDELPQSKLLRLPDNAARYTYNVVQMGDVISLTSSLQINNSLFGQDEYPNLREFYSQMVAKQAEQIVLKKK